MAASINKEQIIELVSKYRDILVLVGLLALAGWGYTRIQGALSMTVEDRIRMEVEGVKGGGSKSQALDSTKLVQELENKRSPAVYSRLKNPFGTPAEQLRLRQEVQQMYQKGEDLFKNEKYEQAIQQFNRLLRLDVTETRIEYPVRPSEYIRMAEQRLNLRNLETTLAQVRQNSEQAAALVSSSPDRAIDLYEPALAALKNLIEADPKGEAMGQDRFKEVSSLATEIEQTVTKLKRDRLAATFNQITTALSTAAQQGPNNATTLLPVLGQAREILQEAQQVDPEFSVVPAARRTELQTLTDNTDKMLVDSAETVAEQVRTSVANAVAQGDFNTANAQIKSFAALCSRHPDNGILATAQVEMLSSYLSAVIGSAGKELTRITEAIAKGDTAAYDEAKKEAVLEQVVQALTLGPLLTERDRTQLLQIEEKLRRAKPMPTLNTAYDLVSFNRVGNRYRITLKSKADGKDIPLTLELKRKDPSGFVLGQVDSKKHTVILSKLPEYAPSQFQIP
ncbi:MAG TPA: hypothetical protein PLQ35_04180 [bacterium]|nr:hypothetical protein [bacterium]HQL61469.1 hypothetical protein [bacterium]